MRLANPHSPESGFTLVEVLIAMAITAFVSVLSYQTLSTALAGIESARTESERLHEINRAFTVLSRDVRQIDRCATNLGRWPRQCLVVNWLAIPFD